MATPVEHEKLLDQLQTEVNRVLEQTGRVFAASASSDIKNSAVAQASRLKLMLPESVTRFHDALDQLEAELHLARLAMRRDLALCNVQPITEEITKSDMTGSNGNVISTTDFEPAQASQIKQDNSDVVMKEEDGSTDVQGTDLAGDQPRNHAEDSSRDEKSSLPSSFTHPQNGNTDAKDSGISTGLSNQNQKTDESTNKSVSPTKLEGKGDDDIPPDTALSNTADLESLFGPTSASVGPGGGDFGGDDNNGDLFDFGFSTNDADGQGTSGGNNDIEAFLPGLQDYANTQPGEGDGGTDFDALFSDFNMQPGTENKDNETKGDEGGRDTTFDELMDDFGLDAGDFDATNGTGMQDDFNFDFT